MATSVEVYGFAGQLATGLCGILFVVWAFVPDDVLLSYGITYYPSKCVDACCEDETLQMEQHNTFFPILSHGLTICRTWALVIPAWCLVLVFVTFLAYERCACIM